MALPLDAGDLREFTALDKATDEEDIMEHLKICHQDASPVSIGRLRKASKNERTAYGGQSIAQAIRAVQYRLDSAFVVNSLHCYFVSAAKPDVPTEYTVEKVKDGRSLCLRSVTVRQQGRETLRVLVSLQKPFGDTLSHHQPMPEVPPPEECKTVEEGAREVMARSAAAGDAFSAASGQRGLDARMVWPVEQRFVNPEEAFITHPYNRPAREPVCRFWFRSKKLLPDDLWVHQCTAAFFTDLVIGELPLAPFPYPEYQASMVTSLDHAIWFHCPFRADEWLLADYRCHRAVDGRGLTTGHFYRRSGELAVTVTQESLFRLKDNPGVPKQAPSPVPSSNRPAAKL